MTFAVPTVFRRPNALASHHINHPASNVRTDITILRKNKSTGRKKAPTVRSPDSWHNLYFLHFGANLPDGALPVGSGLLASHPALSNLLIILEQLKPFYSCYVHKHIYISKSTNSMG